MLKSAFPVLLFFSVQTAALDSNPDEVIHFDSTPFKHVEMNCDNPDKVSPQKNDFELIDYALMSTEQGERFALVTIKNKTNGQRIFKQNQLMAILGNCSFVFPQKFEFTLSGNETTTRKIYFGLLRYPIVKIIN